MSVYFRHFVHFPKIVGIKCKRRKKKEELKKINSYRIASTGGKNWTQHIVIVSRRDTQIELLELQMNATESSAHFKNCSLHRKVNSNRTPATTRRYS